MDRTSHSLRLPIATWLIPLGLAGCLVGPDYETPEVAVPESWNGAPNAPAMDPDELATWWTRFEDPVLDELIERARADNLGLRRTLARIEEVRARRGIARGDWAPDIDLTAGTNRSQTSLNGNNSNVSGFQFAPRTLYDVGIEMAWELDLFGRVRRSVQAANADLGAATWDLRDALVLLQAEVATAYTDLRQFEARLAIARRNLDLQRSSASIAEARFEAGMSPAADVSQARSQVYRTNASIPALEASITASKNRLCTLLGSTPGSLDVLLTPTEALPAWDRAVAAGIPQDVLRQRPDVRRAERELAAQTARIGVATAELYPSLEFRGSFSYESSETDNLFEGPSEAFRLGPSLRWNLLEFGRIRNAIRAEDARAKAALADYEEAVLRAYEEVENALASYAGERERRADVESALREARRSVDLVRTLWEDGNADYQNLLDAQETLASLEELDADNRSRLALHTITLFRALGGGWQAPREDMP